MSLTDTIVQAYNRTRDTADDTLLCHYPWTTINFDQSGKATACCYNRTHVLGIYPWDSIEQMWFGRAAEDLRDYLERRDFSHGCRRCLEQLLSGNYHGTRARGADRFAVPRQAEVWRELMKEGDRSRHELMPKVLEFEIHNTCNLECIMCNGHFSSLIRKNRDHLPPLQSPYNAAFVEQLVPFIPHLREMRFLGGEPFLVPLYYDIWTQVAEHNPDLAVTITTNATILKPRTRRLLEQLNCHIVASIDSIVKPTYEHVRVHANFDEVMENVTWLRELVDQKGNSISFAVCPMTLNWRELPDLIEYCTERGIHVFFNTMVNPYQLSLRSLPSGELDQVIEHLSSHPTGGNTLAHRMNAGSLESLIAQLRAWRAEREEREAPDAGAATLPHPSSGPSPEGAPAHGPQASAAADWRAGRDVARRRGALEHLSRAVAGPPPDGVPATMFRTLLDHVRAELTRDLGESRVGHTAPTPPSTQDEPIEDTELRSLREQLGGLPIDDALTRYTLALAGLYPLLTSDSGMVAHVLTNLGVLRSRIPSLSRVADCYGAAVSWLSPLELMESLENITTEDLDATLLGMYG